MDNNFGEVRARKYNAKETVFCESVGEYTLPDYLPEIRKLLRIETRLLKTGQYVGNHKAEFTGMTVHTVIYSDEEGHLCSAVLNGDYRYAVPLTDEEEVEALTESRVERVVHRLSGPRRIGIRTGISSVVSLFPETSIAAPDLSDADAPFEYLYGKERVSDVCRVQLENIELDDRYRLEGLHADEVRSVSADASVFVRETRPQAEGFHCSGEVWVKVLYVTQNGDLELPDVLWRKIPFDVLLPDGAGAENCLLHGTCTALDVAAEDDGLGGAELIIRLQMELEGALYINRELSYVKDMYCQTADVTKNERCLSLSCCHGLLFQNFTVSGAVALEEPLLGARAVDATVTPEGMTAERVGDKIKITGECRADVILRTSSGGEDAPQYERTEFTFPVKMEFDLKTIPPEGTELSFACTYLGGQLRADGQGLRIDGDMAVSVSLMEAKSVVTVEGASVLPDSAREEQKGLLIVTYPDEGETLWSVAKRYRADLSRLALRNHIPARFLEEPDAQGSIDGMNCLLIG